MILPDINLLVCAYNRNRDAPHHAESKTWWERLLNGAQSAGLPWAVVCGVVRLMTHPTVLTPLGPERAVGHARSWFDFPSVEVLEPGPRHLEIFERILGGEKPSPAMSAYRRSDRAAF